MDTTVNLIKDSSDPDFYSIIITHDETGSSRGIDLSFNEYKQLSLAILLSHDSKEHWEEVFNEYLSSGDVYRYDKEATITKLKQRGIFVAKL